MAPAILQDRRTVRAAGIVQRSEVIPVEDIPGLFQVRDSVSGSGEWHLATASTCDCYDAGKGHICKHMHAVRVEESALVQFCADWDARAEQARQDAGAVYKGQWYSAEQLQASREARAAFAVGDLVNLRGYEDCRPSQVREVSWLNDGTERVRSTTVDTDATNVHNAAELVHHEAPPLTCHTCGGHAESLISWVGGRGHVTWAICTVDSSHPARRLS
jgi:hypothetical protein